MVSGKNGIFCRNAMYMGVLWLRLRLKKNEKIRMVFTGVSLLAVQLYCGHNSMAFAMSNIDTFSVAYFATQKSHC